MMLIASRTLSAASAMLIAGSAFASVITSFEGGSIAPGTSSYVVSATMFEAGTYNVVTFNTLHPSWVDFFDHTSGDGSSGYMVVNGAAGAGGMAWAATLSVAPGTDYTAAAWFASVYPFATATLRFVIVGDGTLTGPGFGAPATTATWLQSSYTFNSGTSTSISLQIWDTTGISDGNDYAIDDITFEAVPAPGAAALLTLAAAPALRRRRRASN